jgi:hypothetical protein
MCLRKKVEEKKKHVGHEWRGMESKVEADEAKSMKKKRLQGVKVVSACVHDPVRYNFVIHTR